jgi:DNA-binding IclR family transcriptional regulator
MSIENYLTVLDRRVLDVIALHERTPTRMVAAKVGAPEHEVRLILRGLEHFGMAKEQLDGQWRCTTRGRAARRAAA